jgi:hypothetical protein
MNPGSLDEAFEGDASAPNCGSDPADGAGFVEGRISKLKQNHLLSLRSGTNTQTVIVSPSNFVNVNP